MAVVVEPDRPLALLVDQEHPVGVAVEGQPDVGADLEHPGLQVGLVLRLDRVGRVVGEGAVELAVDDLEIEREASNTAGTTRPPMPLAVSATTFSGASASTSTKQRTWSAKSSSRSTWARRARLPPSRTDPASDAAAPSRISARPLSSPTVGHPERQNLMPLYCAGLCDAVNMAPGASSDPAAKYSRSVEPSPRSTTSRPCDSSRRRRRRRPARRPRAACPGRPAPGSPPGRSRPTKRAKATPIARAIARRTARGPRPARRRP